MELQPGFPAAQDLRTGDCILAIAGQPFPAEMATDAGIFTDNAQDAFFIENATRQRQDVAKVMFQERIRAVRPGSVASFTILREGKVIDIPVQLAAVPAISRDTLSTLVDLRNQLMHNFVDSLKTGEDPQSVAAPLPPQAKAEPSKPGVLIDEIRIYNVTK
jgi:hypothetical protein